MSRIVQALQKDTDPAHLAPTPTPAEAARQEANQPVGMSSPATKFVLEEDQQREGSATLPYEPAGPPGQTLSAVTPQRLKSLSLIAREFRRGIPEGRPLSILMLFTDDEPETTRITFQLASFLGGEAKSPLLLVDVDNVHRRLTKQWNLTAAPGFLQTLNVAEPNPQCFLPSRELGICFCPIGKGELSLSPESFQNRLLQRTVQWQRAFQTLLFHASLETRHLNSLASVVDRTFAFVQMGRSPLNETQRRIAELQATVPLQSVITIDPRDWS